MISSYSKHREEKKRDWVNQWVRMFAVAVYACSRNVPLCLSLAASWLGSYITICTRRKRDGEDEKVSKWFLQRVTKNALVRCHCAALTAAAAIGHSVTLYLLKFHQFARALQFALSFFPFFTPQDSRHSLAALIYATLFMSLSLAHTHGAHTWSFPFTPEIRHFVNGNNVFQYSTWERKCVPND